MQARSGPAALSRAEEPPPVRGRRRQDRGSPCQRPSRDERSPVDQAASGDGPSRIPQQRGREDGARSRGFALAAGAPLLVMMPGRPCFFLGAVLLLLEAVGDLGLLGGGGAIRFGVTLPRRPQGEGRCEMFCGGLVHPLQGVCLVIRRWYGYISPAARVGEAVRAPLTRIGWRQLRDKCVRVALHRVNQRSTFLVPRKTSWRYLHNESAAALAVFLGFYFRACTAARVRSSAGVFCVGMSVSPKNTRTENIERASGLTLACVFVRQKQRKKSNLRQKRTIYPRKPATIRRTAENEKSHPTIER